MSCFYKTSFYARRIVLLQSKLRSENDGNF